MEAVWTQQRKEPGPYFHLCLSGPPISDLMHPYLGMYSVPFFGYYGPDFPYGDMLCIVKGTDQHIRLPEAISRLLAALPASLPGSKPLNQEKNPNYTPKQIRIPPLRTVSTHFIISDISAICGRLGNTMMLVDHAWVFKDWTQQRQAWDVPKCIIPLAGFREVLQRGVKFGTLRSEYMSMHSKSGALCISPKNNKVEIDPRTGICKAWTVAIDTAQATAVVSLHWVICDGCVPSGLAESENIADLVRRVPELAEVFLL